METFNFTTTSRTILADLYTPVGIYMRLRDVYPQSALMESSDYHEQNNSRSFIGIRPIASVAISHGEAIRTFVSRNGELWFQAGGGIVAKSDEEYELQEVNNKLGALRRAILMAEKM